MKNYLIDTHAHLDMLSEFDITDVGKVVVPSVEISTMEKVVALSEHPNVYSMVGIYPSEAKTYNKDVEKKIKELANNPKVVAVGEIGLDYYWDKSFVDTQKEVFIKQIELANQLNLPIIIHTRESIQDMIHILRNEIKPNKPSILHCCPFNRELVKEGLKLDFYISFAGPVTYKNSKNADEIIQMVPNDKILIETDSPYLSPEPFRGTRNDSRNRIYLAKLSWGIYRTENISWHPISLVSL